MTATSGCLRKGEWLDCSSLCYTLAPISLAMPTCMRCANTGKPGSSMEPIYQTGTSVQPAYVWFPPASFAGKP